MSNEEQPEGAADGAVVELAEAQEGEAGGGLIELLLAEQAAHATEAPADPAPARIEGVVVGEVVAFDPQGAPIVTFPGAPEGGVPARRAEVETDGDRLELTAEKEIVLRCGNASITLTRAGKILIRGAYVLSRSSGVNRIQGGSVEIN